MTPRTVAYNYFLCVSPWAKPWRQTRKHLYPQEAEGEVETS